LEKSVFSRVAIGVAKLAERSDADRPQRLSFLVLDYAPALGATVQPYFIDDLTLMYDYLAPDTPVYVQEGQPALDPAALNRCARDPLIRI
jgi:hypothetical protein